MVVNIFRDLGPINLPYGVVCMDRRITYTYGSSAHSEFIYTETHVTLFFTLCRILFNNL